MPAIGEPIVVASPRTMVSRPYALVSASRSRMSQRIIEVSEKKGAEM